MKFSTNTLSFINKNYGCAGDVAVNGIDDLAQRIGMQLGGIEEVMPFGDRFAGVVIAKVISCGDHPDADRLHVCMVDDGGVVQGVERDEHGYVQVVCGAPNVREGLQVAWLPPGTTVPETYGKDPFVLEARKLRGVVSNGMLASPRELTLGDSHEGILEITDDVAPGTLFIDAYNLRDDTVIDIENKMFTHRPDCFGWLGVAREIEGIYGRPYKSPDWYTLNPDFPSVEADPLPLTVRNELPELVSRFTAITLRDVEVKQSPVWLQVELAKVGIRSINNIVDYTNFFMLETGQPLHAYDYDKVMAQDKNADHATIVVRKPHEDETICLLNGKVVTPRTEAIMIATDDKLIGIGGVMGGADTEVDWTTKNIIIECANFDMYSIRRTSMAHGLFTDAVTRFNKGQSPLQNRAVLAKIVDEIRTYARGKVASEVVDDCHVKDDAIQQGSLHGSIVLAAQFVNERLGTELSASEMQSLLANVEFMVVVDGEQLSVTAPFWRTDIAIAEDVVEEIGRLYGYDRLPLSLPVRTTEPATRNVQLDFQDKIRRVLSAAGANEALSYSFVHENLLQKVGQDNSKAFKLSNALSPELQYYRLSLTPSLLDKVHANIKAGHDTFMLYEIGKAHVLGYNDDEGLPREFGRLSAVFAASERSAARYEGAPYYQAKYYLEHLLSSLKVSVDVRYEPLKDFKNDSAITYYAAGRSASIFIDDVMVGRIGEYSASVHKNLKLPAFCAGFELALEPLLAASGSSTYTVLSKFPRLEQDICLRVASDVNYGDVWKLATEFLARQAANSFLVSLSPVDVYRREEDATHKQITLRVTGVHYERTMVMQEMNAMLTDLGAIAAEKLGAETI